MRPVIWALAPAIAALVPGALFAGHHKTVTTVLPPACYAWKKTEITETVYEVRMEERKVKVKRPAIVADKPLMVEKVCKAFPHVALKELPVDLYRQDIGVHQAIIHRPLPGCDKDCADGHCKIGHKGKEGCGKNEEVFVESSPRTCLLKEPGLAKYPVLSYEEIPVENKYPVTYLRQDCQEIEVTVKTPVKVPKTITRVVWTKEPVADCVKPNTIPNGPCPPKPGT